MSDMLIKLLDTAKSIKNTYDFLHDIFNGESEELQYVEIKAYIYEMKKDMLTKSEFFDIVWFAKDNEALQYITDAIFCKNDSLKLKFMSSAFACFSEVLSFPNYVLERSGLDLQITDFIMTTCHWGKYLFFAIHRETENMVLHVLKSTQFSPSLTLFLYPKDYLDCKKLF